MDDITRFEKTRRNLMVYSFIMSSYYLLQLKPETASTGLVSFSIGNPSNVHYLLCVMLIIFGTRFYTARSLINYKKELNKQIWSKSSDVSIKQFEKEFAKKFDINAPELVFNEGNVTYNGDEISFVNYRYAIRDKESNEKCGSGELTLGYMLPEGKITSNRLDIKDVLEKYKGWRRFIYTSTAQEYELPFYVMFCPIFIMLCLSFFPAQPEKITTKPVHVTMSTKVIDGDTFHMEDGTKVRIWGIDTPEKGQEGYFQAAAYLEGIFKNGKELKCAEKDIDRYKRSVMKCTMDGKDIAAELVKAGYAKDYTKYSDGYYKKYEKQVKK